MARSLGMNEQPVSRFSGAPLSHRKSITDQKISKFFKKTQSPMDAVCLATDDISR